MAKVAIKNVESTGKCKIGLFVWRTLILVFLTSVFVWVNCWFSSIYSQSFYLWNYRSWLFGNILSDEFVCIFYRSLLPWGIRIGEIDDRSQILCNELVCSKFRAVVSGYGLDVLLVGQQQTPDRFGQWLGLFPMGKFGHEEQVCGTFHDGEYGVVVSIHNQIHLKIPKAFSVRLFGTRMNARSLGNYRYRSSGLRAQAARQNPRCFS